MAACVRGNLAGAIVGLAEVRIVEAERAERHRDRVIVEQHDRADDRRQLVDLAEAARIGRNFKPAALAKALERNVARGAAAGDGQVALNVPVAVGVKVTMKAQTSCAARSPTQFCAGTN